MWNLGTGRLSDLPTGMQGAGKQEGEQGGEASWFESWSRRAVYPPWTQAGSLSKGYL